MIQGIGSYMLSDHMLQIWPGIAVICGGILYIVRLIRPGVKKIDKMYVQWNGIPAEDGFPGRPGVMERLATIESELQITREASEDASFHSKPNHGNSAYDKLLREVQENRTVTRDIMDPVRVVIDDKLEQIKQEVTQK